MPLYTDQSRKDSDAMCVGPEEGGDTFCGGYCADYEVDERYVDTLWDLLEDNRLHDDCDCEDGLLGWLGFEDRDDYERVKRRRRVRSVLAERRGGD